MLRMVFLEVDQSTTSVLYLPVREYEYTPTVIVCYRATHTIGKWKVAKQENMKTPRS